MKSREADFGVLFRHWLRANPKFCRLPVAFELKQTASSSISFSCVAQAQIDYALSIKSRKGTLIRVQGTNGEPDYIWCHDMPAYFVIKYPNAFYIIDVETWELEKKRSKRKSLTEVRANEIAIKSVKTKQRA